MNQFDLLEDLLEFEPVKAQTHSSKCLACNKHFEFKTCEETESNYKKHNCEPIFKTLCADCCCKLEWAYINDPVIGLHGGCAFSVTS